MYAYAKAYRTFAHMLSDPNYQIHFRLDPGKVLVFDHQRVLWDPRSPFSPEVMPVQGCFSKWQEGNGGEG